MSRWERPPSGDAPESQTDMSIPQHRSERRPRLRFAATLVAPLLAIGLVLRVVLYALFRD